MLESHPEATLLAGGTDLMVEVNLHRKRPGTIVCVRDLSELGTHSPRWIGAATTFRELESSSHPALAELARTIGSPQIRYAATLGGNLGTASPAGDSLPFLLAMDAEVLLRASDSVRSLPIADFLVGPKANAAGTDELIEGVSLSHSPTSAQAFAKVGTRSAMVISSVSACVVRRTSGWAVAVGACSPTAIRIPEAEAMLDHSTPVSADVLENVAMSVRAAIAPIDDHRSTAAYRRHAAGVLVTRCVQRCLGKW